MSKCDLTSLCNLVDTIDKYKVQSKSMTITSLMQTLKDLRDSLPRYFEDPSDELSIILISLNGPDVRKWCIDHNCEIDHDTVTFPDKDTRLLFVLRWGT